MRSFFKDFFFKFITEVLAKYLPVIIAAFISGFLAIIAMLGSFGDTLIAASIGKMVPSWVEISFKNDKIKEILKELQQDCGQECYASQLYIKKINVGVITYFNSVMGYSERLNKTIDIKSFMDSNSIYYQRYIFTDPESLGLPLLDSGTGCTWINKNHLKEQHLAEIVALLDSLHVDIQNITACMQTESQTIILLTWHLKNDCGKCLDNVYEASKAINRILQAKFI